MLEEEKKRYKAAGVAAFALAAGLAVLRIGASFLWDAFEAAGMNEVMADFFAQAVFTIVSQVGICLVIPFLIYRLYQKRSFKQVLSDGNYRRLKWWIPLICVPLAFGVYMFTIFISNFWLTIIMNLGYTYSPSPSLHPDTFQPVLMIASLLLIAVLPAICEEFAMRGNILTTLRHTYKSVGVVLMAAMAFGLFHQNITQVFYTAFFGAFTAFLVIKTGSIFPAMVIHFVNNAISVYLDYDSFYGWGAENGLNSFLNKGGLFVFLFLGAGIIVGITAIILRQSKRDNAQIKVLMLYKPSLQESAWFIGAIVLASLSTFFTFLFGF